LSSSVITGGLAYRVRHAGTNPFPHPCRLAAPQRDPARWPHASARRFLPRRLEAGTGGRSLPRRQHRYLWRERRRAWPL